MLSGGSESILYIPQYSSMLTEASWLWAGDHPYERLMSFLRALGPCWNLQRTTWHSQAGSLLLPPQAPLAQSRLLGHMLSCVG